MKNIVKDKVKSILDKYTYYLILTLIIFILFILLRYSEKSLDFELYIDDNLLSTTNAIYDINNEYYMHIDDLTNVFKDNIYNDKISGKIIITTYDNLIKIDKNDENYVIRKNDNIYFNLEKIMACIGNSVSCSQGKIHVLSSNSISGIAKYNRVELYDKQNGNVIGHISKGEQVKVYVDNLEEKTISIEASIKGKQHYGYILKNNIEFEYDAPKETIKNNKIILVKAEDEFTSSTDKEKINMVALNMYRLSGVNSLTKLQNVDDTLKGVKVIATINNGQKAANYDQDIVSRMLNSEENRYEVIQQILNGIKKLAGVNLNFANLKAADKEKYTQFVKELAAVVHKNNKIIIVNIPSTQYIDCEAVSNYADYIVIQPYYSRTTSSKTSGPISSISYVKQFITEILSKGIDANKVILEIPTYTILWTERRGTVIHAEQYNMKTMAEYIKQNGLQPQLDAVSGQNHINYTKGITTYKMWLEDEYSILKKAELVNTYNLAGLSIYKSGMEIKEIYSNIQNSLNK